LSNDTARYGLKRPPLNQNTWHDDINNNMSIIDALLFKTGIGVTISGVYNTSTLYALGEYIIDDITGDIYVVLIGHTSHASNTFSIERINNPTYWLLYNAAVVTITNVPWTPELIDGGGSVAGHTDVIGESRLIGDVVHISGKIILTDISSLFGNILIKNLPYKCITTGAEFTINFSACSGILKNVNASIVGRVLSNTTTIDLLQTSLTTSYTQLQESNLTNTTQLIFSGTYITGV